MKQSKIYFPTLKEAPAEAQIPSHQLMIRAGLIRQLGAGIFSFLPLGYRIAKKVMNIIREEMDKIGGQEFHLPALNPIEIWEQTGRVEAMGDVMFHIKNRDGLVLAPTHEEIITFHARQHIKSYRDMPQIWYQIQTKFRNEPRPKSGALRGRQFTMKDSYSLDATLEGLDQSYEKHASAYRNIYSRCGLKFFVVGASSGAMGGSASQEFMVESPYGEDTCAVCDECGYAANLEIAASAVANGVEDENLSAIEEFATPGAKTINDLVNNYKIPEVRCAKSVVYIVDSKPVLILMRGNDELNESKLQAALKANETRPAEAAELLDITGANAGSIGPVNLKTTIRIIADNSLRGADGMTSGANRDGWHLRNINLSRDCNINGFYDLREVKEGEPCVNCGSPLRVINAIEVGHIFKLGTKYSAALGAEFLDENGAENPIIMGSYGIGVERIMACFIEQNHDDKGICWSPSIAPYQAHILGLNVIKSQLVRETAEKLVVDCENAGIEILYDDRDVSPGVKFNDSDLLGIPVQIIAGERNIKEGKIEIKIRQTGERLMIDIDSVAGETRKILGL